MVPGVVRGRPDPLLGDGHELRDPVGFDAGGLLQGTLQGPSERLPIDGIGIGQGVLTEVPGKDIAQAAVLADDLRARAGQAVDRDEHGMGLLAQRVAGDQPIGGFVGARQVAIVQPALRHDRQRVLEPIGQPFTLGREAIVAETLEQIAPIERDGVLRVTAGLESRQSSKRVTSSSMCASIRIPTVSVSMSSR